VNDFPAPADVRKGSQPVPRRIRGIVAGRTVFDTRRARYVWDSVKYPQYYVPLSDVDPAALREEGRVQKLRRGTAEMFGLAAGKETRRGAARVFTNATDPELANHVRFDWDGLDAWFEEDEQIFVHPRNPYTRVDALRSSAHVGVVFHGAVLAESAATVMVFETGLPTRYYFDRTSVDFTRLTPTATQTACPYKGRTSDYWTATVDGVIEPDIAWSYLFPTAALLSIAGLVAFYNDRTEITVDGVRAGAAADLSRQPAEA
jgi:uncharacterized protein (DUF427 family)